MKRRLFCIILCTAMLFSSCSHYNISIKFDKLDSPDSVVPPFLNIPPIDFPYTPDTGLDPIDTNTYSSVGLLLELREDGKSYRVAGVGEFKGSTLTVPEALGGKPITEIGSEAFLNCSFIKSLSLPSTITNIGANAFKGCDDSIFNIAGNLYYIPGTSSDYEYLVEYRENTPQSEISMSPSTKLIASNAFYGNDQITVLNIGEGVQYINEGAFYGCQALNKINFTGEKLKTISAYAFANCDRLFELRLPQYLNSIDSSAFESCDAIQTLTLPDSLTTIGEYAFSQCRSLTQIDFGNGIRVIGNYSFEYIAAESLSFPKSVRSIGWGAFYNCPNLKTLSLQPGIEELYADSFPESVCLEENKTAYIGNADNPYLYILKCTAANGRINIKAGTCGIAREALNGGYFISISVDPANPYLTAKSNCVIEKETETLIVGISNSEIPSDGSVRFIAPLAFSSASELVTISIPGIVESIGEYAFSGCRKLSTVIFHEGLHRIDDYAFRGCNIGSLDLPDSLTSIGSSAFKSNSKLITVGFGKSLAEIGESAFAECAVSKVVIPSSLDTIPDSCFMDCKELQSVSMPNVEIIGKRAFSGCTSLKHLYLSDIITEIGESAFQSCQSLETVDIPNDIRIIRDKAFRQCTALKTVTIPANVRYFGEKVFWDCTSLEYISFPGVKQTLVKGELYNCDSLRAVYLHSRFELFKEGALANCPSLSLIYYEGTREEWEKIEKEKDWKMNTPAIQVVCSDGIISID